MNLNFLEFEQPIAELEAKIDELHYVSDGADVNINDEVKKLKEKSRALTKAIFSALTSWQISQLARHPQRPYALDYIQRIFTDFEELHGDRHYADDHAIVGGLARLDGAPVMVIGQQKGRDTKEKLRRNFGMPRPEGYRKALRLMKMAERFDMPVLTFIDTPGAYPGIGAEERGQSEAIARNLLEMGQLRTPIICTVIGEGGSGGALAIGVGDRTLMLQYMLGITSARLSKLGLIDRVIEEPLGGAHRNVDDMAANIKIALTETLEKLQKMDKDKLLKARYKRLMDYGEYK